MKKFMIWFLLFLVALILFMPKQNLYYTLKNIIKSEHVVIEEESLSDNLISLSGEGISVFYDGIESVKASSFSLSPWLVYNKFVAYDVKASDDLKKMFDYSADKIEITHSVLDYKNATIEAEGDFGSLHGTFDVMSQTVKILLEPSAAFEKNDILRQYFKNTEEGYVYESKIN